MFAFLRRLENVFAAAAFAEAGDWDTARRIARDDVTPRSRKGQGASRPRPRVRAS